MALGEYGNRSVSRFRKNQNKFEPSIYLPRNARVVSPCPSLPSRALRAPAARSARSSTVMFFGESRRSNRRTISRYAKLQRADGTLLGDCMVTNISDSGVRLHIEGLDVPDRFVLLISDGEGGARPRNCKVIWRLGFELGVEFLDLPGRRGEQSDVTPAKQPATV